MAEKEAEDNKDLRAEGYDTVFKAKSLVETKCPGAISCSDILAIAARDYVHLVSLSPPLTSLSIIQIPLTEPAKILELIQYFIIRYE